MQAGCSVRDVEIPAQAEESCSAAEAVLHSVCPSEHPRTLKRGAGGGRLGQPLRRADGLGMFPLPCHGLPAHPWLGDLVFSVPFSLPSGDKRTEDTQTQSLIERLCDPRASPI